MPSWYVHMQAAAQTAQTLKDKRPAGSPLTQQQADDLFTAAHDNRNYLAVGAVAPDLFFLLPDYMGAEGKGVLALVNFVLSTWKALDENFFTQWERWMTPVLDENSQLVNSLSGGMIGEISQVLGLLTQSLANYALGLAGQMVDVLGLMTSGTQTGVADSGFYWSDMFHYRKTYQFARQLYANALKADVDLDHGGTSAVAKPAAEPSRVPKQQAFALGWMSHCATDVAAHPFTNAKCGGPYRTHWHRHHVVENHMDAFVYNTVHGTRGVNYDALDVSALHFRMAFRPSPTSPDPTMPDDEPFSDYFPGSFMFPQDRPYPETEHTGDARSRKDAFDVDTQPLPEHICELLIKTMQDVYTGPDDMDGPRILQWDPGMHVGSGGRPTVQMLQNMYQFAYDYNKFVSSAGLGARKPMPPDVITDLDFPMPPGLPADGNADPAQAMSPTFLDVLLAIVAYALWLLEVATWLVTSGPALLAELATWPAREALYAFLVMPAWDLYMTTRKPLVLEGYLLPKPEEISTGLVVLGADEKGALIQLRADLDAPSGVSGPLPAMTEPSGLVPSPGVSPLGYGLDPAYPRALLTDLDPPWLDAAPLDAGSVSSEHVAPWRYPDHNMAGMRNGWEAPRTHVGPYIQGQHAGFLMGGLPGSDTARRRFEAARTPEETEAVSAELLTMPGQHLGDPIDYGVYLIGQLTGSWQAAGYVANDHAAPLPDFNLDSDRGYAYQCWDYLRHAESKPPAPQTGLDQTWPDQWLCAPMSKFPEVAGIDQATAQVRDLYGYPEPCTVPQQYVPTDNPHHRSRYDPLKRLVHRYLPRAGEAPPPPGCLRDLDVQVSEAEMRATGMSTTGRRPV